MSVVLGVLVVKCDSGMRDWFPGKLGRLCHFELGFQLPFCFSFIFQTPQKEAERLMMILQGKFLCLVGNRRRVIKMMLIQPPEKPRRRLG